MKINIGGTKFCPNWDPNWDPNWGPNWDTNWDTNLCRFLYTGKTLVFLRKIEDKKAQFDFLNLFFAQTDFKTQQKYSMFHPNLQLN